MKKILIVCGIIIGVTIITGCFLYNTHPILLKWISGSARIIGKPIKATVYTDGRITNDIKVFREKTYRDGKNADKYVLKLTKFDKYGMLEFININLDEKWIGRPTSTNEADYDLINGYLFQSDVSYLSTDFRDNIKGFDFDPHLEFDNENITFNVPPDYLLFNSVRIVLN